MARKQILTPAVIPLMLSGLLAQAIVPLARLATTYQALELGLGAAMIGLLTAVFALLPVFLAVLIGRFNDRGGADWSTLLGGIGIALGCLLLWLGQNSLPGLLMGTALLGISQTAQLSALQLATMNMSSRTHRDAVLGNYMVAISLGQSIGPLLVGLTTDDDVLLGICLFGALLLIALVARLNSVARKAANNRNSPPIPLREIAATPGLTWIILTGSICLTAQDLLLAFMPLLGVERGIAPGVIGALLSIRALSAMLSRALFGRAVKFFGRLQLLLVATSAGGLALLSMALPLPIWAMCVALSIVGFGSGIALTSGVALTMVIAPPSARGTALTLRLTVNRLAQFGVPLVSGLVLGPLGAAGIFALSGAALLGLVVARPSRMTLSR